MASPEAQAEGGEERNDNVAAEIAAIQKEIAEMDNETIKLQELTTAIGEDADFDSADVDKRSVYVGNVDYGSTPEEIQEHFKSCGQIKRITILVDRYTGSPKGFAYIEFGDEQSVLNALLLNDSLFRARQLKVVQKRTNIPNKGKDKGAKGFKGAMKGKGKGKGKFSYPPPWFAMPYGPPVGKFDYKGGGKGKGKMPTYGYKGYPYY